MYLLPNFYFVKQSDLCLKLDLEFKVGQILTGRLLILRIKLKITNKKKTLFARLCLFCYGNNPLLLKNSYTEIISVK